MQYMLLIYNGKDSGQPSPDSPEFGTIMKGYMDFTQDVKDNGAFIAGDALQDVETATTVRVRGGETATTDGPFAETKEQLGGYYLLECKDLDEALGYAARIPTAAYGSIEVRPVVVWD